MVPHVALSTATDDATKVSCVFDRALVCSSSEVASQNVVVRIYSSLPASSIQFGQRAELTTAYKIVRAPALGASFARSLTSSTQLARNADLLAFRAALPRISFDELADYAVVSVASSPLSSTTIAALLFVVVLNLVQ